MVPELFVLKVSPIPSVTSDENLSLTGGQMRSQCSRI